MEKKKVAFICVHNSCRSQIVEALGRHLAGDVFESYSAGTETKPSGELLMTTGVLKTQQENRTKNSKL